MSHTPSFQYISFTVEFSGGNIIIDPKPHALRGEFSDVITWTALNNLDLPISVSLDGLGKAIGSFNSPQNSETPPFDPGDSAALSGSITAKPKSAKNYSYSVTVTYNGMTFNVDPDLQVDPPSGAPGGGKHKLSGGGKGGKKAPKGKRKGARKK
jgi:hypothetical protein